MSIGSPPLIDRYLDEPGLSTDGPCTLTFCFPDQNLGNNFAVEFDVPVAPLVVEAIDDV